MKTLERNRPVYFTLPADESPKFARRAAALRLSESELAKRWTLERLDLEEFPCLEFRSNSSGRFAVIRGTRLAVWHVAALARELGWSGRLKKYFRLTEDALACAEGYARKHETEITALIGANDSIDFDQARRVLPGLKRLHEAAD